MERIRRTIRQFKLKDFLAPLIFLLMLVPSWTFRLINKSHNRRLWLVAEEGEARDNGYYFYKYVRENHPDDYCFYAIKPESAEYQKVKKLGNIMKYGGLKHWLYYMSANLNISSQKSGNPCPIFWYFTHVTLGLYKNRVFLQHGVIKDDLKFVYYGCSKFKYFVCGARREYDYVLSRFGYNRESLLLSGLPRWDSLIDNSRCQKEKTILIMPTWRNWLGDDRNSFFETTNFEETDYYIKWSSLLNNQQFLKLIESNNIKVYFYPHINMMKYIKSFHAKSKNIRFAAIDCNIQDFLSKCNLMITDYSSAVFDFAYLGKPIIYYQFDLDEYRRKQYREGYFSYQDDGFGDVLASENEIIKKIGKYVKCDFRVEAKYRQRMKDFFSLHDRQNCKRVYEAIK